MKRLLRGKDNKELAQKLEPTNADPPPKPMKTENATSSGPSQKSGETVCPNEKCGKIVPNPLKLTDLSQDPAGTYFACPYCLSRLDITTVERKISPKAPTKKPASPKKVSSEKIKGPEKCPHYLGYLKERPKGTTIPNECLTCPEAVKCLLG